MVLGLMPLSGDNLQTKKRSLFRNRSCFYSRNMVAFSRNNAKKVNTTSGSYIRTSIALFAAPGIFRASGGSFQRAPFVECLCIGTGERKGT